MNFFEAQDNARRNTWRLAALFVAAVVSLIIMTNLLVAGVYAWTSNYAMPGSMNLVDLITQLPGQYWLFISTGVLGVVGVASLYKYLMLRGGGRTIAEALGGRLISRSTSNPAQQRVLNVVEEMAIASGIAVPPVYLIDEPSINAFAAGFTTDDAVIGVNQGTIDLLNRDELQGVIGHEFSHILNGDTRINLRLMAILHGILFIGMIGYGVLRGVGMGASTSRRSNSSSGGLPVLALALGLLVIGYAGTFFGNLIKAAVSRQREYLADAAAVQFTRNPTGIAGALKKIGGLSTGSSMPGGTAAEASHLFFGAPRTLFLNRLLSTHPPLPKRIRAIDPEWNGQFPRLESAAAGNIADVHPALANLAGTATGVDSIQVSVAAEELVDRVGVLDQQGLDSAQAMIASTASVLRAAAHDPYSGRAMIHAMLLSNDADAQTRQLQHLAANAEPAVRGQVLDLHSLTHDLDEAHKVMLVEMVIPTLKELSHPQYQRFMGNAIELIKADARIDLFEWVLHRLLVKELRPHFDGPARVSQRYDSIADIPDAALVLLSALAREGDDSAAAFAKGRETLQLRGDFDTGADANFQRLNQALRELRRLRPLAKPQLIKACAEVATAGGELGVRQGALLQGIAAALDCPLPPSIYASSTLH